MRIRYNYPQGNQELELVALGYITMLTNAGHTVVAAPMSLLTIQQNIPSSNLDAINPDEPNWDVIMDHIQYPSVPELEEGFPTFFVSSWLADKLPEQWIEPLTNAAGVIVPSTKMVPVFEEAVEGLKVVVAPLPPFPGADTRPIDNIPTELKDKNYLMALCSGHSMDHIESIVIDYYQMPVQDDAVLVISVDNPLDGYEGSAMFAVKRAKEACNYRKAKYPAVLLMDGTEDAEMRKACVSHSRALIILSQNDPWALGIHTAFAAGVPVITTGLQQEFTDTISILPVVDTPPPFDAPEYGITSSMKVPAHNSASLSMAMKTLLSDDAVYEEYRQSSETAHEWLASQVEDSAKRLTEWFTEVHDATKTENESKVGRVPSDLNDTESAPS
jgi:hypothetical protein